MICIRCKVDKAEILFTCRYPARTPTGLVSQRKDAVPRIEKYALCEACALMFRFVGQNIVCEEIVKGAS